MGEVKRGEGERPTGSDRRGWRGGLPHPLSYEALWKNVLEILNQVQGDEVFENDTIY